MMIRQQYAIWFLMLLVACINVLATAERVVVLDAISAQAVIGHDDTDPCLFRYISFQCYAPFGIEEDGCDVSPLFCAGDCTLAWYCDGTAIQTVCRTGSGPVQPAFLSLCSDEGTVACGQALRGLGECSSIVTADEWGNITGVSCECELWLPDPDMNCDVEDIDNIEINCDDGGAPV